MIPLSALALAVASSASASPQPQSSTQRQNSTQPRLILQITVDQLRGDLPRRWLDAMGEGGFRRLLDHGVVFTDAHHRHANTETIVGHTTLATGADPAVHGMVGNVWYDRGWERVTYAVEDARHPLLSGDAGVDQATEIDPSQTTARSDGRSPGSILVSTIADEVNLHSRGHAKVFGVSVKDRGAIAMAGHSGKAFWFSKKKGEFVTSRYYYPAYPDWVQAWNEAGPCGAYDGTTWALSRDAAEYEFGPADDQPWETDLAGFSRTFPHPYGASTGKYFHTLLTLSPAGDEIVAAFAKELIVREGVGTDDITDYVSVSLSSTDYVGHMFGPSSLEAEDNLLRLDRTLADLLSFVDERIGLDRTLVVLSADHGGAEAPGYLIEKGMPAGLFSLTATQRRERIQELQEQFGLGEELLSTYSHPYLNLNDTAIAAAGLDHDTVAKAVAEQLELITGVHRAVSSAELAEGRLADTPLHRKILNNFSRRRSGDIYIVFDPHWMIADFDGLTVASTHGSPWTYDTYVPVIFAGAGLQAQQVHRRIHSVDVAPTIAAFLEAKPPSGATGMVLPEVLNARQ